MDTPPPSPPAARHAPSRVPLSPAAAVLLAISFGLCGGYLDLFLMLFKKLYWEDEWILRHGRDFPWTVPVAHAILLLIPGMMIASCEQDSAATHLAVRRVVAVRDAGDLGGPAQAAAVRRLHPLVRRGAGSADQRRVRHPWLVTRGRCDSPCGAPRPAGCAGGALNRSAGDPGTPCGGRIAATTPGAATSC